MKMKNEDFMFDEYDVVKAKRKLSDKVLKNSIGTVVMIFPEFPNDYTVEFMKDEKTLDILDIKGEDIEKININL